MLISNRCMVLFPTFTKNLEWYLTHMHTVHINHQVSLDRPHSMAHNEIQSRSLMIKSTKALLPSKNSYLASFKNVINGCSHYWETQNFNRAHNYVFISRYFKRSLF